MHGGPPLGGAARKESVMSGNSAKPRDTRDKVDNPETHYRKPADVAADKKLSPKEKSKALDTWEQDARQLLTASNEGMAGGAEGLEPSDNHRLGEVVRAKAEIGKKPKQKPSH
jgi:hypothetical protein